MFVRRVASFLLAWCAVCGQQPLRRAQFEAATVKPTSPSEQAAGLRGGPGTGDPTYFTAKNLTLMDYVKYAYGLIWNDEYALLPWMNNNGQRFDVTARVPAGATRAQLKEMIQVLLEERFALKFHHEKREQLFYRLVLAKGGPKLRAASPAHAQEVAETPVVPTGPDKVDKEGFPILPDHSGLKMGFVSGGARIRAYGQTMERISGVLSGQTGRRVIDATGLTGKYDFTLAFLTSASAGLPAEAKTGDAIDKDLPGVTIFGAVEKQLGLRLEPAKQVGNVFVVDSMQKTPTSN